MTSRLRHFARHHRRLLMTPAFGLGLATAACGGLYGSPGSSGAAGSGGPAYVGGAGTGTAGAAAVDVRTVKLGTIITDAQGRTLYLFKADQGAVSYCDSACASVWPPFTTAQSIAAGKGTSPALLSTAVQSGGQHQVTYNGHLLYYYAGDARPGDTRGQGLDQFGAEWTVVTPQGNQVNNG